MSIIFSLLLASGASTSGIEFERDWQSCLIQTSKIWASKYKLDADTIFEAAQIYCRDKMALALIGQKKKALSMGLPPGKADEYVAFQAAIALQMDRKFAVNAINEARGK